MAIILTQGATITFENDVSVPQEIGLISSFSLADAPAADIDITNLASSAKESRQGLQDFGELTINVQRDFADAGQAELLAAKALQATREVVITLTGGTTLTFDAYVKSFTTEGGGPDTVLTGVATLKISGSVVIA